MNFKVLQLIAVTLSLMLFAVSCKDYKKNSTHKNVPDESIEAGKKLAAQYCSSCHQLPDPSLLDTKTWELGVLPQMAPRLGIFAYNFHQYPSSVNDPNVGRNYYPSQPVISFEQWQNIIDYFTATSPDSLLPAKKSSPIQMNDKLFKAVQPSFIYPTPATSFISLQPNHQLITSDVVQQKILFFNDAMQLTDSLNIKGAVTDVIQDSGKYILCNTGILSPNNGKFGSIEITSASGVDTLFDSLMRPVQLTKADLNKDGKDDFVVCEFGNLKGALSWLQYTDTGYVRHVIRAVPGAIHAYINDYNHDGLPDIWALFAQGDEGIFLFTNKGNGNFDTKQILQFLPSYGSSSFELDDINKDGFADIIYTCGDNADYSPVLKPYHGVYIFLNDGKNNFTQKYFYPVNGCYKAIARDFDNDGDLDIATISFFADYTHQPEEGFVYLKNEGNFKFQPYSLPQTKYGRWLTMDAGDIDGDGKIDLVLANFSVAPSMAKKEIDWTKQPEFLLLKNIQ